MSASISQSARSFALIMVLLAFASLASEAKLLRGGRSRYYDEYDGPYSSVGMPTGERAIMTVRGARNPYDGSAPSKIAIEDNPYRGAYPRGVYDRLDSGYGGNLRRPIYPQGDFGGYSNYGGYGAGSGYGGYGSGMFGAPNRIAVTGAFPYGYGSRGFAK